MRHMFGPFAIGALTLALLTVLVGLGSGQPPPPAPPPPAGTIWSVLKINSPDRGTHGILTFNAGSSSVTVDPSSLPKTTQPWAYLDYFAPVIARPSGPIATWIGTLRVFSDWTLSLPPRSIELDARVPSEPALLQLTGDGSAVVAVLPDGVVQQFYVYRATLADGTVTKSQAVPLPGYATWGAVQNPRDPDQAFWPIFSTADASLFLYGVNLTGPGIRQLARWNSSLPFPISGMAGVGDSLYYFGGFLSASYQLVRLSVADLELGQVTGTVYPQIPCPQNAVCQTATPAAPFYDAVLDAFILPVDLPPLSPNASHHYHFVTVNRADGRLLNDCELVGNLTVGNASWPLQAIAYRPVQQ